MVKEVKFDALNFFNILEIPLNASDEEIKNQYKELVKKWHPDYNTSPDAVERFQKISQAYNTLKDEESRLAYILLSMIYNKNNMPNRKSLAIIKNMHQQEDLNMRAFRLIEVKGTGVSHKCIDKVYYCNHSEAVSAITNISRHNWIYGFLGVTSIFANIKAIINNFCTVDNREENLKLFIHNAIAYTNENRIQEALTLLAQARAFATPGEEKYINRYITAFCKDTQPFSLKRWNTAKLYRLQLIYPLIPIFGIVLLWGALWLLNFEKGRQRFDGIKQTVVFKDGNSVYSDISVSKIFDIPVDLSSKERLYYVTEDTVARHGADDSFDIYKEVKKGTTVRLTGYTVDEKWFRVMLDDGNMAFIKKEKTKKGIGNEIPLWSKIYKEN